MVRLCHVVLTTAPTTATATATTGQHELVVGVSCRLRLRVVVVLACHGSSGHSQAGYRWDDGNVVPDELGG